MPEGTIAVRGVLLPSLAASTAAPRPARVATTDHPNPLRAPRRLCLRRPMPTPPVLHRGGSRWPCGPSVDLAASPPRVPLRRFSDRFVHSRSSRRNAGSSAPSCQGGGLVPPSWFLATSAVFSEPAVRALLQPAADPGVHRVSRPELPANCSRRSRRPMNTCPFPAAPHPSKMLPAGSASSAHRATRR